MAKGRKCPKCKKQTFHCYGFGYKGVCSNCGYKETQTRIEIFDQVENLAKYAKHRCAAPFECDCRDAENLCYLNGRCTEQIPLAEVPPIRGEVDG